MAIVKKEEHRYAKGKRISTAKDLRKTAAINNFQMDDMSREQFITMALMRDGVKDNKVIDLALGKPIGKPLIAEINHSRLIVTCPYCMAGMAWDYNEDFYCMECLMVSNNGKPRPVKPPEKLEAICELLEKRPRFGERNLIQGETLKDIQKENKEMKVMKPKKKPTKREF